MVRFYSSAPKKERNKPEKKSGLHRHPSSSVLSPRLYRLWNLFFFLSRDLVSKPRKSPLKYAKERGDKNPPFESFPLENLGVKRRFFSLSLCLTLFLHLRLSPLKEIQGRERDILFFFSNLLFGINGRAPGA